MVSHSQPPPQQTMKPLGLLALTAVGALSLLITMRHGTQRVATALWRPAPVYTLRLQAGDCPSICADHPLHLPLHTRLHVPIDITLRPGQPVPGPGYVQVLTKQEEEVRRLHVYMATARDGSLRLRGILRDILDLKADTRGALELILVVSRWPWPLSRFADQQVLTAQLVIKGSDAAPADPSPSSSGGHDE